VLVATREKARERERESERECVCVCVRVRESVGGCCYLLCCCVYFPAVLVSVFSIETQSVGWDTRRSRHDEERVRIDSLLGHHRTAAGNSGGCDSLVRAVVRWFV